MLREIITRKIERNIANQLLLINAKNVVIEPQEINPITIIKKTNIIKTTVSYFNQEKRRVLEATERDLRNLWKKIKTEDTSLKSNDFLVAMGLIPIDPLKLGIKGSNKDKEHTYMDLDVNILVDKMTYDGYVIYFKRALAKISHIIIRIKTYNDTPTGYRVSYDIGTNNMVPNTNWTFDYIAKEVKGDALRLKGKKITYSHFCTGTNAGYEEYDDQNPEAFKTRYSYLLNNFGTIGADSPYSYYRPPMENIKKILKANGDGKWIANSVEVKLDGKSSIIENLKEERASFINNINTYIRNLNNTIPNQTSRNLAVVGTRPILRRRLKK